MAALISPDTNSQNRQRRAANFRVLLWLAVVGTTLRTLILIVWDVSEYQLLPLRLTSVVFLSMALAASYAGYVRLAETAAVTIWFGLAAYCAVAIGNVGGEPVSYCILLILGSGLAGGPGRILLVGGGSLLLLLSLTVCFSSGVLTGRDFVVSPGYSAGLSYLVLTAAVTILFFIGTRSLEEQVEARRQVSHELASRQAEFLGTLDHAPLGIATCDRQLRLLHLNVALTNMIGCERHLAEGSSLIDLLNEEYGQLLTERVQRVIASAEADSLPVDVQLRSTSERKQVCECRVGLIRREGGDDRIVVTLQDVTEERLLQQQLERIQRHDNMSVLAGGIAHDFNNLLCSISGNTEVLTLTTPADFSGRRQLSEITLACEKGALLTGQLLAYARAQQPQLALLQLDRLVQQNLELFALSMPDRLPVRLEIDRNLPPIRGDAGQMQQVIMNLMLNAAEASSAGGSPVELQVHTRLLRPAELAEWTSSPDPTAQLRAGESVCLSVNDTGCGMDHETRGRMFDPFFTTKSTGHGLGLSAVLGIVCAHHGGLKVVSEPGHGTQISLVFPVAEPATNAAAEVSCAMQASHEERTPAQRRCILVIDDEPSIRQSLQVVLQSLDYDVLTAEGGQAGLDQFRSHPGQVDAVILDMVMPGMNGAETFRRLREIAAALPIVISSGYSDAQVLQRVAEHDHVVLLPKPWKLAGLQAALSDVLA